MTATSDGDRLAEAVREAGEAALMVTAAVEAHSPGGSAFAVSAVYGDRMSGWEPSAEVLAVGATPQGLRALQVVAEEVGTAVGRVVGDVLMAHALALTRLAQVTGQSREAAVAELVEIAKGGR